MTSIDDFGSEASGSLATGGAGSKYVREAKTRKEQIEAELKLIEWHKMANEAAIKSALLQNKQIREMSVPKERNFTQEDSKWMRKVIDDEHNKPLEVSKNFIIDLERREIEKQEHMAKQVESHIHTLRKLRNKIEQKADVKQRSDEYRSWQRDFTKKKNAVMLGKTVSEFESESRASSANQYFGSEREYSEEEATENEIRNFNESMRKHKQQKSGNELTNVLESLNKLADLEKRITNLEGDNKYDQILQQEKIPANARVSVEFQKKRVPLGQQGPVGVVYAAKKVDKVANFRRQQQQNGNAFLTDFESGYDEETDNDPETQELLGEMMASQARRERDRAQATASEGKKSLRSRIQSKKLKTKEIAVGEKKHKEAMAELIKRREEQQKFKPSRRVPKIGDETAAITVKPAKGAASGKKTKNKHMQEFQDAKNQFDRKRSGAPQRSTKTIAPVASRTAPANMMRPGQLGTMQKSAMTRRSKGEPSRPGKLPAVASNSNNNNNNSNNNNESINVGGRGVEGLTGLKAIRMLRGTSH